MTLESELTGRIRAEIESARTAEISFARYMERALYEPGLGYYRRPADRPTDAGDFLTAPETHAIFGGTVARRIEEMWAELGRRGPFRLIEYGAGSGTLALSILDGMRRHGAAELLAAVRYEPVEIEPEPRRPTCAGDSPRPATPTSSTSERSKVRPSPAPRNPAGLRRSLGPVPVTGVILANEFLDALPVHRVVVRGGQLRELFVGAGGERLRRGRRRAIDPGARRPPRRRRRRLAEGQVAEICLGLGPWLGSGRRLARGYVLAIDYGYDAAELYGPRRLAGTLLGYRGHRVEENPFAAPGELGPDRPRRLHRPRAAGRAPRLPDRLVDHAVGVPRRRRPGGGAAGAAGLART